MLKALLAATALLFFSVSCSKNKEDTSQGTAQSAADAYNSGPVVNQAYYGIENFRTSSCPWAQNGDQVRYLGKAAGKFRFQFIGNFSTPHGVKAQDSCDIAPQEFNKLKRLSTNQQQYSCLKADCFSGAGVQKTSSIGNGSGCHFNEKLGVNDCRSSEEVYSDDLRGRYCDPRQSCCGGVRCSPGGDCYGC